MTSWIKELFGTEKPIIAMCHLQAMPGDPYYDSAKGMKEVLEKARHDLLALQRGGVDAVMFSNEFSLPYLTRVKTETVACMARIIGELMEEIAIPYGVNCLWDPIASLDLAVATEAKFVREIFTGVYASDFGLWNTDCGSIVRHQREIGAEDVRLLFNIVPEAARYLTDRSIESIAKTTVFNCRPDVLCVSGATAGSATDPEVLAATPYLPVVMEELSNGKMDPVTTSWGTVKEAMMVSLSEIASTDADPRAVMETLQEQLKDVDLSK